MSREYWRSLDELADTPEYRALVEREFPGLAEDLVAPQTRRAFLKVMGASLGVAGLAACRWPRETIVPFAHRPADRIPGVPQQYATAMDLGGAALGLLVTSYDGRPIKVEGNPLHPTSRGAASAVAQASLLGLYDPDRSKQVLRREGEQTLGSSWDEFAAFAGPHFAALRASGGAGLIVLAEASSSPSLARLRTAFAAAFPAARWFEWEPVACDHGREAGARLFGQPVRPQLHLGRADVLVCLDADPLSLHPDAVRHAREFAARRRAGDGTMNRLFVVGPAVTLTAAAADRRLAVPAGRVLGVAARLLVELRRLGVAIPGGEVFAGVASSDPEEGTFAATAARELAAARGRGLVVAGAGPSPAHEVAALVNFALGNTGRTVTYTRDGETGATPAAGGLGAFLAAAGGAGTALLLGGNPAYAAPPELRFAERVKRVPVRIRLGEYEDETSHLSTWHLPRAHYLESWGDARAWDGTHSVQQPLIEALYGGRTALEVVALALGEAAPSAYEIVRATFRGLASGPFAESWRGALNDGVLAGSSFPTVEVALAGRPAGPSHGGEEAKPGTFEAVFVADAKVYDGRFANNAWLQELPDPLSKVTWDNAALLAPATAAALGVVRGDVVRLAAGGRAVELAVFVMPGQAPGTVVLALGYGRTAAGPVGDGVGADVYPLRPAGAPGFVSGVTVEKTGRRHVLACTQDQHPIDRIGYAALGQRVGELVREGTLAGFLADPGFVRAMDEGPASAPLFASPKLTGEHQWAMSIDLSACIGCNACMVACQAENNIAVVGREQVIRGRAMHWIRVDRYFSGKPETAKVVFQPMACQQCENAPCEQVCPVGATMHSDEGLNEQVYNRCVGTRYCSNNCPYKVRRFNFFNYFKNVPESEKLVFNPEVTVRGRGVMEKCTYCVQRIEAVKIAAGNDRRAIRDGEIVPACAQTCPAQAIVFGDIKDPGSQVSRLRADKRAYAVLGELNTRPRTTYLAKLRNPPADVKESG